MRRMKEMESERRLRAWMRWLIEHRGVTQARIAEVIGLDESSFSITLRTPGRAIRMSAPVAISEEFGIPLEDLCRKMPPFQRQRAPRKSKVANVCSPPEAVAT